MTAARKISNLAVIGHPPLLYLCVCGGEASVNSLILPR